MSVETLHRHKGRTSYFDGGLLQFIGWIILGALVTAFTFGICYPWAITRVYGWKINHTVIDGRRVQFNGSALGLLGHWMKWWCLTIITLAIHALRVLIQLAHWRVG